MASVKGGPVTWRADRDDDGFRTYKVTYRVQAAVTESPAAIMMASGLPSIGETFVISGYSGTDSSCWCRPEMSIKIDQERSGDPAVYYLVECTYSNKFEQGKSKRCQLTSVDDPCVEPMKVSGSFTKAQWEAKYDQNGAKLVTSANEPITGPAVTFDYARPTVRIEQNVRSLGLSTFSQMVNTVNASPLWGCPARTIRLMNAPWERKYSGLCNVFYTRTFEFEVDYCNKDSNGNVIGWDRDIYDSGSSCLAGIWDVTDAANPKWKITGPVYSVTPSTVLTISQGSFGVYKDLAGNNKRVVLDGYGRPANAKISYKATPGGSYQDATAGPEAHKLLQFYRASNFLLLGIPTSF